MSLLRHHNPSRPDQLLPEAVPLLHRLDDNAGLNAIGSLSRKRFMERGVEPLPSRIDSLDPVSRERVAQAPEYEQHTMRQTIVRISLGIQASGLKSPLEVIEHRQNIPKHFSFPTPGGGQNISAHPLPEVLEVSFSPLRQVQVLVPLPLGISKQGIQVVLDPIRSSRGWRGGWSLPRSLRGGGSFPRDRTPGRVA